MSGELVTKQHRMPSHRHPIRDTCPYRLGTGKGVLEKENDKKVRIPPWKKVASECRGKKG